jgi:alkyl sulfatase BDS1-like metallo-beta-lactamase superfamily hydrolase
LHEALQKFGKKTDVVFASHHWPHWGNQEVVSFIEKQRDMYKYIHDQTLRLANQGYTMTEIGEELDKPGAIPASIGNEFFNRGYYGSVNHDAKAVYQRYLGWFDANPAHLHQLPPEEVAKKYVDAMGGEETVLRNAREAFDRGDYRWVAEMVNHVVFANPNNQAARFLQADALEQLGYQAENATWRAFYLTGAMELREGTPKAKAISSASPDIIRAMSVPMVLQYLATRVDGPKAANKDLEINLAFSDSGERYYVTLKNGVMNYSPEMQSEDADVTYTLTRKTFDQIQLGETKFEDALKQGDIKAQGNEKALAEMMSTMVTFDPMFNIVTP